MLARKIVVLLHANDDRFESARSTMELLMGHWRAMGASVEVVRGIDRLVEADLLIPHVNLTVVPPDYVEFMSQYPTVVNRHVLDISKSRISANLVRRGDAYQGPVIVKTDRNFGGRPERRLIGEAAVAVPESRMRRLVSSASRNEARAWRYRSDLDPNDYPIFDSIADVPAGVFKNAQLVVEKFLPEIDDDGYCLRTWVVFGDRGLNRLSRSRSRIVKSSNVIHREEVPVPDELRRIREDLKADFAKFDYVIRDGEVMLFDVNRTPTGFRGRSPSQAALKNSRMIAEGIFSLR
jgi:hypothetical protein